MSASTVPPLPLELHLHILRLAYPSRPEDDYQHRRRDLLWCSLVSKAWKELAEPLLWYSLTLSSNLLIDWLTKVPEHLRHLIRHVVFRGGKTASVLFRTSRFRTAFRLLPELESVVIVGAFKLDATEPLLLSDFECLGGLRSLAVNSRIFLDPRASLPHLSTLHLSNVSFERRLSSALTPSAFSALSHLSLGGITDLGLDLMQLEQLAQQLDILEVDMIVAHANHAVFHVPFNRVLLVLEEDALCVLSLLPRMFATSSYPPIHFLLRPDQSIPYANLYALFKLPHPPKSLFLPDLPATPSSPDPFSDLDDELSDDETYSFAMLAAEHGCEDFLERCKNEGVEVRYCHLGLEDWRTRGCTEFREYVNEQKGREEQRAGSCR